jgi:hypothetical protein
VNGCHKGYSSVGLKLLVQVTTVCTVSVCVNLFTTFIVLRFF